MYIVFKHCVKVETQKPKNLSCLIDRRKDPAEGTGSGMRVSTLVNLFLQARSDEIDFALPTKDTDADIPRNQK